MDAIMHGLQPVASIFSACLLSRFNLLPTYLKLICNLITPNNVLIYLDITMYRLENQINVLYCYQKTTFQYTKKIRPSKGFTVCLFPYRKVKCNPIVDFEWRDVSILIAAAVSVWRRHTSMRAQQNQLLPI